MLKITRNQGQAILIGDDVTVHYLKNNNGDITLGISAPKHISVDRSELREKKNREKRSQEDE